MSNRLTKSLVLTPALALMAACASGSGGSMPRPPASGSGSPSGNTTVRWNGQILSTGVAGNVRGSAAATTIGSRTEVVVSISRGTPGGEHPWHVHRGTCGSGGPVVGSAAAYPILRPDQAGNANEVANLSVGLDPAQSYYVNIHESPQNPGSIVACAELTHS